MQSANAKITLFVEERTTADGIHFHLLSVEAPNDPKDIEPGDLNGIGLPEKLPGVVAISGKMPSWLFAYLVAEILRAEIWNCRAIALIDKSQERAGCAIVVFSNDGDIPAGSILCDSNFQ